MEALKDTLQLILILVGVVMAVALAVIFWPMTLLLAVFYIILVIIKVLVDGRF